MWTAFPPSDYYGSSALTPPRQTQAVPFAFANDDTSSLVHCFIR